MKILYATDKKFFAGLVLSMAEMTTSLTKHQGAALLESPWRFGCYLGRAKHWFVSPAASRNEALDWADVVVGIESVTPTTLGRPGLERSKLFAFEWVCRQKSWGTFELQFHGVDRRRILWTHMGGGWQRDPKVLEFKPFFLPNPVPINDPFHAPVPFEERARSVSFAPSHRSPKVAPKAVDETLLALRDLPVDLVYDVPFEACMRRRAATWIGVDEVATNVYNRSSLEILALGLPCINRVDQLSVDYLLDMTGARDHPMISVHDVSDPSFEGALARLRSVVMGLLIDPDKARAIGERSRAWMERNYDPAVMIGKYVSLFERKG